MKEYTLEEVKEHSSIKDLWIIFDDKVYDLTSYIGLHPGGRAMLRQAGKDASQAIRSIPSHGLPWSFIEKTLKEHQIGIVKR